MKVHRAELSFWAGLYKTRKYTTITFTVIKTGKITIRAALD